MPVEAVNLQSNISDKNRKRNTLLTAGALLGGSTAAGGFAGYAFEKYLLKELKKPDDFIKYSKIESPEIHKLLIKRLQSMVKCHAPMLFGEMLGFTIAAGALALYGAVKLIQKTCKSN